MQNNHSRVISDYEADSTSTSGGAAQADSTSISAEPLDALKPEPGIEREAAVNGTGEAEYGLGKPKRVIIRARIVND